MSLWSNKSVHRDVFLSYNRADSAAVELLASRLREEAGLEPFLDRWHLVPGEPWQEALEQAIEDCSTCAVFLGPAGLGTWENESMRVALDMRAATPDYRVIPVLLPGATLPERGRLPGFLARLTWVDFRTGLDDAQAFHALVCGIKGIAPGPPDQDSISATCPFRGLEPFDEEHAEFFFGREALTQHLVEQLRVDRFLAVVGPSGSGKSSLVRAGVLPRIRHGAIEGSGEWPIAVLKPGPQPIETLAARLLPHAGGSGNLLDAQQALQDSIEQSERGLHRIVRAALAAAPDSRRLLLVVDQFEELFTLCRDDSERQHFIANLLYAGTIAEGQTIVVITMRADFLGKCAIYPDLAARLKGMELVGPMDADDLRRAMICPAERVGLQHEKGLVESILNDLGHEPGTLPLLQHTLLELWERRRGAWLTTDAYHEIGSVRGALAKRADSVYAKLTPVQQKAAQRVLLRLTQPGEGTEDTRRRAPLTELLPASGDAAEIETVVRKLADACLLTTNEDERGAEIVDVAHEALIRGWPRLHCWIEENRGALRVQRQLSEAAEAWDQNGRDESFLYRGVRLTEVEQRVNSHDLNPLEQEFVNASRVVRRRMRRRRRMVWSASATLGLILLILSGAGLLLNARQNGIDAIEQSLWRPPQELPQEFPVRSLVIGHGTRPIYYAGTVKHGLAISKEGERWAYLDVKSGLPQDATIQYLAVDIGNPRYVFAAVETKAIYRSDDGGERWEKVSNHSLPQGTANRLAVYNDLVLAVIWNTNGKRLYISRDGGANWEPARPAGHMPLEGVDTVFLRRSSKEIFIGTEHGMYRGSIDPLWYIPSVTSITQEINLIVPSPDDDSELYFTTWSVHGEGALYRWQLGTSDTAPERLASLDDYAIALAPRSEAIYILTFRGEVLAVRHGDERLARFGLYPAKFPLNFVPGVPGIAFSMLATAHPDGGTRLLLGTSDGLFWSQLPLGQ